MKYSIEIYETTKGKLPFIEWLNALDHPTRQRIRLNLDRLSLGNFSNCKSLGESLFEIKLDFGVRLRKNSSLICRQQKNTTKRYK